jgi:hypothetical protein
MQLIPGSRFHLDQPESTDFSLKGTECVSYEKSKLRVGKSSCLHIVRQESLVKEEVVSIGTETL